MIFKYVLGQEKYNLLSMYFARKLMTAYVQVDHKK